MKNIFKAILVIVIIIIIIIPLLTNSKYFNIWDDKNIQTKFKPVIDAGEDKIGFVNISIKFNVTLNYDKNIYSYYTWDYDGDNIIDENYTDSWSKYLVESLYESSYFRYSKSGKYKAIVTIVDRNGSVTQDSCNVTILPDPLKIKINMTKSTYNVSEQVILNSYLTNTNDLHTINIEKMNVFMGNVEIFIRTPENYVLTHSGYLISGIPPTYILQPNSVYFEDIDLTNSSYHFGNYSNGIANYDFSSKGEYTVQVKYETLSRSLDIWKGSLLSETQTFWII